MLKFQYSGRGATPTVALSLALGLLLALTSGPARGQQTATYYRLDMRRGAEWLISPADVPVRLRGLDHIHLISTSAPRADLAPAYVDQRAAAIVAGLRQWGFNALGGDTDADVWHRGLPFVQNLEIARHLQADQQTAMVDVYAADFTARVQQLAQAAAGPRASDPDLVGYFSDEGLDWDPARHAGDVLAYFLQLPLDAPGRQRAVDFLRQRYGSNIGQLNRAWGVKTRDFLAPPLPQASNPAWEQDAAAFAANVLARYLQVCADAIHAADPNHLYLGAELQLADPAAPPAGEDAARLAWAIPDVTSVALEGTETVAEARAQVGASRPLLVVISGCGAAAGASTAGLNAPGVVGYVWSPSGDWQSGACAAQAARVWAPLNQASAQR